MSPSTSSGGAGSTLKDSLNAGNRCSTGRARSSQQGSALRRVYLKAPREDTPSAKRSAIVEAEPYRQRDAAVIARLEGMDRRRARLRALSTVACRGWKSSPVQPCPWWLWHRPSRWQMRGTSRRSTRPLPQARGRRSMSAGDHALAQQDGQRRMEALRADVETCRDHPAQGHANRRVLIRRLGGGL